jgi:hypothetical protein
MTLKKQSIKRIEDVTLNGKTTTKEELILISSNWAEKEIILFKKVLSQGGTCRIGGDVLKVHKTDVIRPISDKNI